MWAYSKSLRKSCMTHCPTLGGQVLVSKKTHSIQQRNANDCHSGKFQGGDLIWSNAGLNPAGLNQPCFGQEWLKLSKTNFSGHGSSRLAAPSPMTAKIPINERLSMGLQQSNIPGQLLVIIRRPIPRGL